MSKKAIADIEQEIKLQLQETLKIISIQNFKEFVRTTKVDIVFPLFEQSKNLTYFRMEEESYFEYNLFKLYCFCDYSIYEIYRLVVSLCMDTKKEDYHLLNYYDFEKLSNINQFESRKQKYIQYKKEHTSTFIQKQKTKETIAESNFDHMTEEYNSTLFVIDCLNTDIYDICNNEDISSEKKMTFYNMYSKISSRLNEKRFLLLKKIKEEPL